MKRTHTEDREPLSSSKKRRRSVSEDEAIGICSTVGDSLPLSKIYNSACRNNKPAELFRKDLISAMKLPDSEQLDEKDFWNVTDTWKQEWERGVQVPVNSKNVPLPEVREIDLKVNRPAVKLSKKLIHIYQDETYLPEIHAISNVLQEAEDVCRYDLDDVDSNWLKIFNEHRAEWGMAPISEETFELIIQDFEIQCFNKFQDALKTEEGLGIEYDDDVICDVCRNPECEEGNEMVFCDICNICVHQACYGITAIPEGSWVCRTCAVNVQPSCVLCPNKGGAMKSTRKGDRWAHVSCALWIPEVVIVDPEKMEPISKISQIPPSRWALICTFCRERVGACIQCCVKQCKVAYHVTCAFENGLEINALYNESREEDGVKLRSYCLKHSGQSREGQDADGTVWKMKTIKKENKANKVSDLEKHNARLQKIREMEAEFFKYVDIKRTSISHVDHDVLDIVYNYWKLKRTANYNKPLLPTKFDEVALLGKQPEDSLYARMKMFVHLRQDLERVRNLCYMVSRREKLRRTYIRTQGEIFDKQCEVFDSCTLKQGSSEYDEVLAATLGNSLYDCIYFGAPYQPPKSELMEKEPEGERKKLSASSRLPNPYAKLYFNGIHTRSRGHTVVKKTEDDLKTESTEMKVEENASQQRNRNASGEKSTAAPVVIRVEAMLEEPANTSKNAESCADEEQKAEKASTIEEQKPPKEVTSESEYVERNDLDRAGRKDSKNVERKNIRNVERKDSKIVERRESRNSEKRESRNIEKRESRNVERRESRNVERRESRNVERRESRNVERRELRNVERKELRNIERRESRNVERRDSKNVERMDLKNIEQRDSKSAERIQLMSAERNDSKDTEINASEGTEKIDSNSMDKNGSKTTEKNDSKPPEKNDSKPTEKNDSKPTEKNDSKPTEKIDSKSTETIDSKRTVNDLNSTERKDSQSSERRDLRSEEGPDSKCEERTDSKSEERIGSKSTERKDLKCVERRDSKSVERRDSKCVERKDSKCVERKDSKSAEINDSRSAERKDSMSAERKDSMSAERKDSMSAERNDSMSAERKDSKSAERKDSKSAERKDSKNPERKDSKSAGTIDLQQTERKGSKNAERDVTKDDQIIEPKAGNDPDAGKENIPTLCDDAKKNVAVIDEESLSDIKNSPSQSDKENVVANPKTRGRKPKIQSDCSNELNKLVKDNLVIKLEKPIKLESFKSVVPSEALKSTNSRGCRYEMRSRNNSTCLSQDEVPLSLPEKPVIIKEDETLINLENDHQSVIKSKLRRGSVSTKPEECIPKEESIIKPINIELSPQRKARYKSRKRRTRRQLFEKLNDSASTIDLDSDNCLDDTFPVDEDPPSSPLLHTEYKMTMRQNGKVLLSPLKKNTSNERNMTKDNVSSPSSTKGSCKKNLNQSLLSSPSRELCYDSNDSQNASPSSSRDMTSSPRLVIKLVKDREKQQWQKQSAQSDAPVMFKVVRNDWEMTMDNKDSSLTQSELESLKALQAEANGPRYLMRSRSKQTS